jgi:ribosomal protein L37AE/L43A
MTNIRILVQESMKKALKAAQKPSLSKRDVNTILKAVANQARRIKGIDKQLPFGPNRTAEYKKKTPEQRKEMQKSYDCSSCEHRKAWCPFPRRVSYRSLERGHLRSSQCDIHLKEGNEFNVGIHQRHLVVKNFPQRNEVPVAWLSTGANYLQCPVPHHS